MSKYDILVQVLDRIREESTSTPWSSRYIRKADAHLDINQARSRAFIHLLLKSGFGLPEFNEREHYITDGSADGGIDAYFIDNDARTVFFIQSKFRTTETNFESKKISLDEILVMDVNRILQGVQEDESGIPYNGKIRQMVREISQIRDIGRYDYKVILLANIKSLTEEQLRRLTGGLSVEVYDYEICYQKLLFPIISGTYFNASELTIAIDLSNKNAGTKISYTVQTRHHDCEITVLFVPAVEIAKLMLRYKNTILRHNPRSYLEFDGRKVNSEIASTIVSESSNEFALLNNGITMISDETYINERIGQRNRAQLHLTNPQIINGGQTAFTLSRTWSKLNESGTSADEVFSGKEVLLKVITLIPHLSENDAAQRLSLISRISTATNQQTMVNGADRLSNEPIQLSLQKVLFQRFGVLYERKRGEFQDGIHDKYIFEIDVLDRNLFVRLYAAAKGHIEVANRKRLFTRFSFTSEILDDLEELDKFYFCYMCYRKLRSNRRLTSSKRRSKELFGKIFALLSKFYRGDLDDALKDLDDKIEEFENEWRDFVENTGKIDAQFTKSYIDRETGERRAGFSEEKWVLSSRFQVDVRREFGRSNDN